jgi:hypothetical protein
VFASAAALLLASACGSSDDPHLGEEERIRFVGGRGCGSSTILAVGATATIGLESATEDPLPGALGVISGDPSVMTARMGLEPATIDLKALKQGESRIEITTEDETLDALVFTAQPAITVNRSTQPRVFAGGAVDVVVNDKFGNCDGAECQLLGDGFLAWRAEPPEQASFVLEFQGVATFRAKAPGTATLLGREPVSAKDLVADSVEIVPVTSATKLQALLLGRNFDPEKPSTLIGLPGSIPRPDAFSVSVMAEVMEGGTIQISRRDVVWRVQGEEIVIEAPAGDNRDPLSTHFLTAGTGKVTLVADIKLLGMEQAFELDLTPP